MWMSIPPGTTFIPLASMTSASGISTESPVISEIKPSLMMTVAFLAPDGAKTFPPMIFIVLLFIPLISFVHDSVPKSRPEGARRVVRIVVPAHQSRHTSGHRPFSLDRNASGIVITGIESAGGFHRDVRTPSLVIPIVNFVQRLIQCQNFLVVDRRRILRERVPGIERDSEIIFSFGKPAFAYSSKVLFQSQ